MEELVFHRFRLSFFGGRFFVEFLVAALLFILGLVFIVKGGDYFVDAASWMAEISGIPKFIVGATIVSIATTMPEMIV
ncbi:MAG: hypothetical protein RR022_08300, partial [Angelakisella sp.]